MSNRVVRFCASALLAVGCATSFAQNQISGGGGSSTDPTTTTAAAGSPQIQFDTMSKDLGEVEDGRKVQFQFEVTNAGTGNLNIPKVSASCGCTNARIEKQSLAPGEKSIIRAEFDTTGRTGEQVKTITVESNDPKQPHANLTVRSKVISEISHTPAYIAFNELLSDSPTSHTITVEGRADQPIEVTSVTVTGTNIIKATIGKMEVLPKAPDDNSTGTRTRTMIALSLQPGAPQGRFSGTVAIGTNSAKKPVIPVPFHGSVVGDIQTMPPSVFLRHFNDNVTSTQIYLKSRTGVDFNVTGVSSTVNAATHTVQKNAAGSSVSVELTLKSDLSRPTTDTLTIKTTNPKQSEVLIPVSIFKPYAAGANPPRPSSGNAQTPASSPVSTKQ